MTDAEYPAGDFKVDGSTAQIQASARQWNTFGSAASQASSEIKSLDTSLFLGPEADEYKKGLQQDLPPHLDTTGQAYSKVGGALNTFAAALDTAQTAMSPLAVRAPGLWEALQQAQGRVSTAQQSDSTHAQNRRLAKANLDPGQTLPPDTYQSDSGAASTALTGAQQAWDDCHGQALQLRTNVQTAVTTCKNTINDAAGMRFKKNPSGLGALVSGFKNFVKDHIAGLAQLSGILKTISFISGCLSFIPVIGEVALAVSMITGGAALAIDAASMWATGKWDVKTLGMDSLALLPGVGKIAGKGLEAISAARAARAGVTVIKGGDGIPTVVCDSTRWPESAQHITEAQSGTIWRGARSAAGDSKPSIVTIDRPGAAARGRAALKGIPARANKGLDRDEYPPKVFGEGGSGSSVKYINRSDNRGFGGHLPHALKGLPNGSQVRIVVK